MRFFAVIFLVMLSACQNWHNILGTTYGWDADEYEIKILLDAQIDKLRIRHVRMHNSDCVSGFSEHLEIDGEIGPDSTAALGRLLPKLHECQTPDGGWFSNRVYLNSGGGFLSDGYALGRLFRKHQVQTVITGGQECASSCAIAFLGGKFRTMLFDAQLLFHSPYLKKGVAIDCGDRGQVAGLEAYYKAALGAKDGKFLLDRTMSYCSDRLGWTINADGAKLFNITTE